MCQPERAGERGGSKLKLLFALTVLGGIIFSAVQILPAYFAYYQLQDSLRTEARFAMAGFPKKGEDNIRDDIWKEMLDLEIPAKREDIKVSLADGAVDISLDYSVPIDLKVYQFTLQFHPHADNHTI